MALTLLCGASPIRCSNGPTVRLHKGSWRLSVEGLQDSELVLHTKGYESSNGVYNDQILHILESEEVTIHFGKRGREQYITVTAEKVA